jgi:DNA-binding NarL/FixJ family response regulator
VNGEAARVLVADDDATFRRLVVMLLRSEGHEVVDACDAPSALAELAEGVFDLVVADVHMPGNEGLAVLRAQQAVPVLIVTGDPTLETAVAALRGSAIDYMTKPLDPERFLARVAEGVARGRALRRLRTTEERLREQLDLVASLRESLSVAGTGLQPLAHDEGALPASVVTLLSPREREFVALFRNTPRLVEVAELLNISPHTAKNHLKAIYRKLEVSSQAELLARLSARH